MWLAEVSTPLIHFKLDWCQLQLNDWVNFQIQKQRNKITHKQRNALPASNEWMGLFSNAMLIAIKQNSGFCWISHRFDNNSYLARLREQMRFTRWRRRVADAMKHDEEEGHVILANSGMDRRNYTKTDIRTQIYGITPLPRPKGWPLTELCFLSPFLVIHFFTNCDTL